MRGFAARQLFVNNSISTTIDILRVVLRCQSDGVGCGPDIYRIRAVAFGICARDRNGWMDGRKIRCAVFAVMAVVFIECVSVSLAAWLCVHGQFSTRSLASVNKQARGSIYINS